MFKVDINSEYKTLKLLMLHEPGPEVENMTPETAERALYSDILNLPIAREEYSQFSKVLSGITKVVDFREELIKVIQNDEARELIVQGIEKFYSVEGLREGLAALSETDFIHAIIEGFPYPEVSLVNFLQKDKYALNPLHNLFFVRDSSFVFRNTVFVSSMAREIRKPESLLFSVFYRYALDKSMNFCDLNSSPEGKINIEGGDVIVVSDDTLIIGIGRRTSAEAIDFLIKKISSVTELKNVIIQELPKQPESFIHLDMVFTILSESECMVYNPVVFNKGFYHTILMTVIKGKVQKIQYAKSLISALSQCGIDYSPILCGNGDSFAEQREQWHSGANFFSFAPSGIIGYARNIHTAEALDKKGYEIIQAKDVINGKKSPSHYKKCLITIEGSELARGGGGPRCMTMPLLRE